jgi:tetratricopeptide (TPR) repeat protein
MKTLALLFLLLARLSAADPDAGIRFLEDRVRDDPADFIAQNQLADRCLARLRATGRLEWLSKARAAADASLRIASGEGNPAGVLVSARTAIAEHRFAEAGKLATQYTMLQPGKAGGFETLFDANLELGRYDEAARALEKLEMLNGEPVHTAARHAMLCRARGEDPVPHLDAAVEGARSRKDSALLAWCLIQRGGHAFRTGDFPTAETHYSAALAAVPGDWRATEHLAELRAAEGRHDEAIALLEKVIASTDRAEFIQAAGDIETDRKRPEAAKVWHDRAEEKYRTSAERGEQLYIHHLAGFYCDIRPRPADAVRYARQDLAARANANAHAALAWALHLDGKFEEAASEATLAIASGTRDAHILDRAGLIFIAAGDIARGRAALRAAAEANPRRAAFHFHR